MNNSSITCRNGFGRGLRMRLAIGLDLRDMLLPETSEAITKMWADLGEAVTNTPLLITIELGRCTPLAVDILTAACPQLEILVILAIRGTELDLAYCTRCTNLTELQIKSIGGIDLKNMSELKKLKSLKHLALTTIKNLSGIENVLPENLESLELGKCTNLPDTIVTEALVKLTNLKRLRLEKGVGSCPTNLILEAVANLPNLVQLELINFDIKPGFEVAIGQCTNLKTLLIIPTYVNLSATTNHIVMRGVSKLSQTLTHFIWGLTLELQWITQLFINNNEWYKNGRKARYPPPVKSHRECNSIPVLRPLSEGQTTNIDASVEDVLDILGREINTAEKKTFEVAVLARSKLLNVLSTLLPNTKIKILKVPYSATWRQRVTKYSPTSSSIIWNE